MLLRAAAWISSEADRLEVTIGTPRYEAEELAGGLREIARKAEVLRAE